jgi:hypothetical protein
MDAVPADHDVGLGGLAAAAFLHRFSLSLSVPERYAMTVRT